MKVTRIAYCKDLNPGKQAALEKQASVLGAIRCEVWNRFGSIAGVKGGLNDRKVRDQWLKEGRPFNVSANAWKETLRDTLSDIRASLESAKVKTRQAIRRHTQDEAEHKRLYTLLKQDPWPDDPYLSRIMRKYWKRGHNHINNQIIVRSDSYTVFEHNGLWLKLPGLERGKRIAIPLTTTVAPTGTLRVILRDGVVEIHYAIEVEQTHDCGSEIIGVDKGITSVFVVPMGSTTAKGWERCSRMNRTTSSASIKDDQSFVPSPRRNHTSGRR
jgi:hypothetical protein